MKLDKIQLFQGEEIKILSIKLDNVDNKLNALFKICFKDVILNICFRNVSRFRIRELSAPLEIYGFEIINHSQDGWEKDSKYEICDFENDNINFFCELYEIICADN